MLFTRALFDLFKRENFTYRKGDDATKEAYIEQHKIWDSWCRDLVCHNLKLEVAGVQQWQNSGQLARYFWSRLKYKPYKDSAVCVSIHANDHELTLEVACEHKNKSSIISKDTYTRLCLNVLDEWVKSEGVDLELFYIAVETYKNRTSLKEYFNSAEKMNWFTNTKGINVSIGVSLDVEKATSIESTSEYVGAIINKLSTLYECVQDAYTRHEIPKTEGEIVPNQCSESYGKEELLEEAYITEEKYQTIVSRLAKKKNIILQGAPGVGKSFLAKRIAYSIIGTKATEQVAMIQFHQSYSYEDFILGYRPNNQGGFEIQEGVFYTFCHQAIQNSDKPYYFIIDEINRGNLSKIFGELMLLIEADKRGEIFAMSTVYRKEPFYIPANVYVIGLMNTADRSLALMDYALRRRFSFIDIEPAFGECFSKYTNRFKGTKFEAVLKIIEQINKAIEADTSLGKGFKIGHSYFCNLQDASDEELKDIIACEIIPLLEEYWVEEPQKVHNYRKDLEEVLQNE